MSCRVRVRYPVTYSYPANEFTETFARFVDRTTKGSLAPMPTIPPTVTEVYYVLATVAVLVALPLLVGQALPALRQQSLRSRLAEAREQWCHTGLKQLLEEALHFDLARLPTITELRDTARAEASEGELDRRQFPLGPNCDVTEGDVRAMYPHDPELADQVVLVLKLSLSLLAHGHSTIDVESIAIRVCGALGMPQPRLSVGHRLLHAAFGSGPAHVLFCSRDFVFSTLADLTSLCTSISTGEVADAPTALRVCDRLLERRLPYGWLVQMIAFQWIGPFAAVSAYYGSYYDALGACLISPMVIAAMKLCRVAKISHLEGIVVPLTIGIMTPLVWRHVSSAGQPICHVTPQYMGPLLIHLPGSDLVWGALEVAQGSVVHGASRLVKGMVRAMLLALSLALGWQVFGLNLASDSLPLDADNRTQVGAVASLPTSAWCSEPFPAGVTFDRSWWFMIGIYSIPLNVLK
eukprot:7344652-Prymnesium_polylepis.2